jgi:ribosomal protein L21
MYAVIQTGGKQYRVEPGKTVVVERLAGDKGASVVFDQVLLVSSGDGGNVNVGKPLVASSSKVVETSSSCSSSAVARTTFVATAIVRTTPR